MEELLEAILAFIATLQADPEALEEFVNADEAEAQGILDDADIDVDDDSFALIMPVLLELLSPSGDDNNIAGDDVIDVETDIELEDSLNDNSDNSTNDSFNVTDSFNPWSANGSLVDSPISSSAGGAGGAGLLGGGSPAEIMQSVVNNYVLNLNQGMTFVLPSAEAERGGEVGGLDAVAGPGGVNFAIEIDNNIVMGDNNAFATNGGEAFSVVTGENHVGHVAVDGDVDDSGDVVGDNNQVAFKGGDIDDDDVHADNGSIVGQKGADVQVIDASGNTGQLAFNGGDIDDDDLDASGNTGQQAFNGGEIENNQAGDDLAQRGGEIETNEAGDDLAQRGGEVDNSLEIEDNELNLAGDDLAQRGGEVDNEVIDVDIEENELDLDA